MRLRVFVLSGTTILATACGSSSVRNAAGENAGPYRDMYRAVCEVTTDLRAGHAERARVRFFEDAHAELHALAEEAGGSDRAAAARLLEAKQVVEAGFERDAPGLPSAVATLAVVTRAAIAAVGDPKPPACESAGER